MNRTDIGSDLCMNRPHVVLLGAGASKAAFPEGEANGRMLPLMNELVTCAGIESLLNEASVPQDRDDFESLYSLIHSDARYTELLQRIDLAIFE